MSRPRLLILVLCVIAVLLLARFSVQHSILAPTPHPVPVATNVSPVPSSPADTLNVVGTYPLGDDLVQSEIDFYFDKTVQWPKQADTAQEKAAVTFDPPLDADVRVQGHVISCKLKGAIPPDLCKLKAKLQPTLQSSDGKPLDRQRTEWEFYTKRLEVKAVAPGASTATELILGLLFSVPVTPEEIKPCLQVLTPDGASIPFNIEQGTDSSILNLRLPLDVDRDAKIVLDDCAVSADGTLKVRQRQEYALPKLEALAVQSIEWGMEATPLTLWLSFPTEVSYKDFKKHLEVVDDATGQPLDFELPNPDSDLTGRFAIQLGDDLPENPTVRVTITAGLAAANGAELSTPYVGTAARPASRTVITGTYWHSDWEHDGRDGLIVDLQLSSPLAKGMPKNLVEVTPPIEHLRVEARYQTISVYGDWDSGQRYEIKVNLPSGVLATKTAAEKVPPYVGFGREGEWYFPRQPGRALTLHVRNTDTVAVALYRMFPSNVAVALQEMNSGKGSSSFNYQWAEKVAEKEIAVSGRRDRMAETPLDLDSLFPADKLGVFCIVASVEGREASKMALWTNLGLLAYWQKDRLALFAHDLYSLAPAPAAKVSVYSNKNQLLGQSETEANGIVRMGPFDTALGEPRVAVVEREGDYTFLELNPREQQDENKSADLQPFDRKAYDAFVYADRNLYRPGEPVHANWLVRTNYGDAASNVPLIVSLIKPNGKELVSQPTTLSALGAGGIDFATQRDYPTGKYTVQLSVPGNKKDLGAYQFSLEEFVPNTIKTTVAMDKSILVAGQDQPIQLNAQHLFGAPASGRKAEIMTVFKREDIAIEGWKGFRFGNDSEFVPEPVPCGEQVTDDAGNAKFTFSYKPPKQVTFPMKAIVIGRVFELGGRPVAGKTDATYFPSEISLGVATATPASGEGIEVTAAAVGLDSKPVALEKIKVSLERQRWDYYVRSYFDRHQAKWSESFETIETREVPLTEGRGSTAFSPDDYGYYRVRVWSEATPQYSTVSFYCCGGRCNVVQGVRPSLIKVVLDKPEYTIGDIASIRIESPFDGRGIVAIQGEEIQDLLPVDIVNGVGVLQLPVTAERVPNVWVEATVVHGVQAGKKQVYPFSSFETAILKVADPRRKLQVAYPNLPQEIRPATDAKFGIDVRDAAGNPVEAELTLAAVDEGIHGITNYVSPDPLSYFMRPRKADLRRAHYYDMVAYDWDRPAPGGDAMLRDLMRRAATPGENWIKPVALWSGTVKTDAAGHADVTMSVPEFSGQLRLDAVACTASASGSTSGNIFVRRPFIVQTSLPRFLLPGDTAMVAVTVFNNGDAPCKASVAWTASGAIVSGTGTQAVDVAAHDQSSTLAEFVAGPVAGQGEIKWEVSLADAAGQPLDQWTEIKALPVRPPAAFQSNVELIALKAGETREFRNTLFVDNEQAEAQLIVGLTPFSQLIPGLKYLVGYPYGCIEQTTSKLMPMYVLKKLNALDPALLELASPVDNILLDGVDRLFTMQTPNGGLSMWPGGSQTYDYGSVYGLHFLTLLHNGRDVPVPEKSYEALRQYVSSVAYAPGKDDLGDLFVRAYALYVLALGGDTQAVEQVRRFDALTMPREARYLLAAALAIGANDPERVKMYLSTAPATPHSDRECGGALNSEIRNKALELLALHQMKTDPVSEAQTAKDLLEYMAKHPYTTTQEMSMVVTALVMYLKDLPNNPDAAKAIVTAGGEQQTIAGANTFKSDKKGPGTVFTVANAGQTDIFVTLTTRGVPTGEVPAEDQGGLKVRRKIYLPSSDEAPGNAYRQGASYVVGLEFECEKDLQNVLVADLLPAGFEIENPRLQPDAAPSPKFRKSIKADNIDVRDDRLLLAFDTLKGGSSAFYYVVRAVTPGTYQYPSMESECMYDPSIRSRTSTGTMEVK